MTRRLAILLLAVVAAACDRAAPPPAHEHGTETTRAPVYQCPMHPQIIRHEPGTCPICGMTLRRVDDAGVESGVPGHVAFTLPMERQQLIGVTQGTAEVRPLVRELRTAATVADDPGLYEAWIEYREAFRTRAALRGGIQESTTSGDTLVRAAALKLRRQGVGEREIAALAELDPTSLILPGARIWIYAQVFEEDVPMLRAGMPVSVEIPSEPGRTITSTILAIDPTVSAESRTVRVRALVNTPEASLRPGTFVTATFDVPLGDRLAIPREAVLDAGLQRLVFVVSDGTRFEPRSVTLGRRAQGFVEVLDGVAAGERVVTSANFLVDSESRLKAAVAAFGAPAPAHQH
jgi:Cu(I)/Ag(I) efflux system membrane fusion protein